MDWWSRTTILHIVLLVGPPLLIPEFVHIPLEMHRGVGPIVPVFQIELLALAAITAVGILVHQYRRWKEYRPAIHLGMALIVFLMNRMVGRTTGHW